MTLYLYLKMPDMCKVHFVLLLLAIRAHQGWHARQSNCLISNMFASNTPFSAAKAALDMQMSVSQSVSQSVSLSVCNAYLFVRFTSIFYNCKSDQMKLKQYLKDLKHLNLSQHTCTLVLVISCLVIGVRDLAQFIESFNNFSLMFG